MAKKRSVLEGAHFSGGASVPRALFPVPNAAWRTVQAQGAREAADAH